MKQNKSDNPDSYFPTYHSVLKATHIKSAVDGSYHKITDGQKAIFHYILDRYKFFKSQGNSYYDNQEDIAEACASVRRSVFTTIKLLESCGYLRIKAKMGAQHKSNSYTFISELTLAVLDKNGKILEEYETRAVETYKQPIVVKKPIPQKSYIPAPNWDDEEGLPF